MIKDLVRFYRLRDHQIQASKIADEKYKILESIPTIFDESTSILLKQCIKNDTQTLRTRLKQVLTDCTGVNRQALDWPADDLKFKSVMEKFSAFYESTQQKVF